MLYRQKAAIGAVFLAFATPLSSDALAEESTTKLFKVITTKDEIIIGFSEAELRALGGADAAAVAHAIAQKGDLAAWQYNVRRGANGELTQAPSAKIGILASASLRVEPYTTTYAVVPHQ